MSMYTNPPPFITLSLAAQDRVCRALEATVEQPPAQGTACRADTVRAVDRSIDADERSGGHLSRTLHSTALQVKSSQRWGAVGSVQGLVMVIVRTTLAFPGGTFESKTTNSTSKVVSTCTAPRREGGR